MNNKSLHRAPNFKQLLNPPNVLDYLLKDDGIFPNNRFSLLIYLQTVKFSEDDPATILETLFETNGWGGCWRNGIFPYHHYHSTAHEVLGFYQGSAEVQLGGEKGIIHQAKAGDVIIIPAGVAHKNLGSTSDFGVVGAYPEGQDWDMNYGRPGERPKADQNISSVSLPKLDPVYGSDGPLAQKWNAR